MNKPTYSVVSQYRPCLVKLSNTTYIIPNWIPVPDDTELDQLIQVLPDWLAKHRKNLPELVAEIKSSKGDMTYKVHRQGNEYTCTCVGFKFKNRNCKHIKQVRLSKV